MGLRKHQNTIVGRHQHCGGELRGGGGTERESGGGADPHCWVTAACSPSLRLPFRILYLNTGTLFLKCYVPMDKSLL